MNKSWLDQNNCQPLEIVKAPGQKRVSHQRLCNKCCRWWPWRSTWRLARTGLACSSGGSARCAGGPARQTQTRAKRAGRWGLSTRPDRSRIRRPWLPCRESARHRPSSSLAQLNLLSHSVRRVPLFFSLWSRLDSPLAECRSPAFGVFFREFIL